MISKKVTELVDDRAKAQSPGLPIQSFPVNVLPQYWPGLPSDWLHEPDWLLSVAGKVSGIELPIPGNNQAKFWWPLVRVSGRFLHCKNVLLQGAGRKYSVVTESASINWPEINSGSSCVHTPPSRPPTSSVQIVLTFFFQLDLCFVFFFFPRTSI